ncbi:MAG: hypothetical protein WBF62_10800, partial [Bradyrhizobium sp.]
MLGRLDAFGQCHHVARGRDIHHGLHDRGAALICCELIFSAVTPTSCAGNLLLATPEELVRPYGDAARSQAIRFLR